MNKKLTRSRSNRWLTGVCGGIGEYAGVDANLVRLVTVILTVVGFGSVVVIYLIAWLLMPQDSLRPPSTTTPPPPPPPTTPAPPGA